MKARESFGERGRSFCGRLEEAADKRASSDGGGESGRAEREVCYAKKEQQEKERGVLDWKTGEGDLFSREVATTSVRHRYLQILTERAL